MAPGASEVAVDWAMRTLSQQGLGGPYKLELIVIAMTPIGWS